MCRLSYLLRIGLIVSQLNYISNYPKNYQIDKNLITSRFKLSHHYNIQYIIFKKLEIITRVLF